MGNLKILSDILAGVANLLTIVASGIAIWVFVKNRKKISAAFDLLLNYSYQTTLGELKEKVERLNEYSANDKDSIGEIRNILHEISGQIRGNKRLFAAVPDLLTRLERLANAKTITEQHKRSMISEVREQLRNISVVNIESIAGIEK